MNSQHIHQQAPALRWMRLIVLLFIISHLSISVNAQAQLEYWFDQDPGLGRAIMAQGMATDADGNVTFEAPTDGLSVGSHLLGVRSMSTDGRGTHYGPTLLHTVLVPHEQSEASISCMEYYWDEDPGRGRAHRISVAPGGEVNLSDLSIPTDGLSPGTHLLGLRAYGNLGWAPTAISEVYIAPEPAVLTVSKAEYFWDNDPGYGKATPVSIAEGQSTSVESLGIPTDGLAAGEHQLFIRYRGPQGWSPTLCSDVYVVSQSPVIAAAEYFWNDDPGFGKGTPLNMEPGQTVTLNDVSIPSHTVHGDAPCVEQ